jgi:DNA-binding CsgD family transcriptional regulator/energy-coupling factor transporter ATP-binding protein EcfA2
MALHVHTDGSGRAESGVAASDVAFFGRDTEVALIEAAIDRAKAGSGEFVILDGPPGAGRSKLLSLAAELGVDREMRVLRATGHESERGLAFGGALQLFEKELEREEPAERASLLSGAAALASPLLSAGPQAAPGDDTAPSIVHGLYRLSCHLAERSALLICVDDAHAMDLGTLQFLLYVSHRLDDVPALVLAAANVETMPPEVAGLVRDPRVTHIRLGPLSPSGTARWLRETGFPDAEDEFCDACHEVTGGDRYYLGELARELEQQGIGHTADDVRDVAQIAPLGVSDAVLLRLARLGPGAVELAEAINTLGAGCELRHAAALAGLDPDEAGRLAERMVAARLIRGAGRLAFAQPIVASSLEAHRTPASRAQAHLAAARMLRDDGAEDALIAQQLMRARPTASGWSVDLLERTAGSALEHGHPERAAGYLKRALAESPDAERRRTLVATLGRAEAMAGAPEALARLRRATELLDKGPERAVASLWTGRILMAEARFRTAASSFRRGLADTAEHDEPLRTELAVSYATAARLGYSDLPADMPTFSRREGATTPQGRLSLAYAAYEGALAGKPAPAMRRMALQALGPGTLVEEHGADGLGPALSALTLMLTGDLQSAEAVLTAVIDLGRERGSAVGLTMAHSLRATSILRRGRVGDALADLQAARSTHKDAWRDRSFPAQGLVPLLLLHQSAPEIALAHMTRWERSADPTSGIPYANFLLVRAQVRRSMGEAEQALGDLLDCGERSTQLGAENPAMFPWRSEAALAELSLGRRDRASVLAQAELELANSFGAPETVGRALHVLGLVEEGADGLHLLEEAVSALDSSQAVFALASALIDYGAALRKASKRRDAREPLRRGVDLARRCEADALVRFGLEELATAGARPRRLALSGADALTTRERQVAVLASQGASNREIAKKLVITLKTVEWHLRQSYRKLGIESRRDLVGFFGSGTPEHRV